MKVINTGRTFRITDNSLKTYDLLPAGVYTIRFSKMSGFFLEAHEPLVVKEDKIYGVHEEKVNKVLKSFDAFNRSLGVILSGDKGIGKSMFARLLSIKAVSNNIPLIIVDEAIPGIASFIEDIQQEVVVLFDEFDKTFASSDKENNPQDGLLSLFDGISGGKKLYIITCNEIRRLNDYLINRPGRFHYHFRFEYPNAEQIKEYLMDKLEEQYYGEINNVIAFSRKVELNYDCLRAIAFEINLGTSFAEAIKDLNIINVDAEKYDLTLHFTNGSPMTSRSKTIDLFERENFACYLYDSQGRDIVRVEFNSADAEYDPSVMGMVIKSDKLKLDYDEDFSEEIVAKAKALIPSFLIINRVKAKGLHYTV